MANPIDRAYLEVDGEQILCDSINIDPEDDTDFVTAMTPSNSPLGFKHGNKRYNITTDVTMSDDEDVDFHDLWFEKTNVPVEIEYEGGTTWSFGKGVISKPGVASTHGEKTTWSLELKCYDLAISN
jgi:hypothetical protein